jgi:hypothetical protein
VGRNVLLGTVPHNREVPEGGHREITGIEQNNARAKTFSSLFIQLYQTDAQGVTDQADHVMNV